MILKCSIFVGDDTSYVIDHGISQQHSDAAAVGVPVKDSMGIKPSKAFGR